MSFCCVELRLTFAIDLHLTCILANRLNHFNVKQKDDWYEVKSIERSQALRILYTIKDLLPRLEYKESITREMYDREMNRLLQYGFPNAPTTSVMDWQKIRNTTRRMTISYKKHGPTESYKKFLTDARAQFRLSIKKDNNTL